MREVTINRNDAGQRLDKFLCKFMPSLPKGMLYKGLRKNCVRINGRHVKDGSVFVREGDILKLYFGDEFFTEKHIFIPIKHNLNIVYEDKNIIIINKEKGTVVHDDDRGTEKTLIHEIQSYLYERGEYLPDSEHSFAPALCNRLDRNTAGLVIAAKNASALRILNEKIKNREVRKIYICAVEGRLEGEGEINSYIKKHGTKVSVSEIQTEGAKKAGLLYKAIAHNPSSTLVEAELLTGRTHQIRAQFAYIGHPLVGDIKYGGSRSLGYQELISRRIIFNFKTDADILNYLNDAEFSLSDNGAEISALIKEYNSRAELG